MKHQFPSDWTTSPFRNVAEVITGTTPSTQYPEYYGGSVPFVGPAELGGAEPVTQSSKWLSPAGVKQARLLPAESVLVCCIGATIGKVGFAGTELATNQQINALVFNKSIICPRYAFHYCRTLELLIRHLGASTTLPLLPKGRFQELEISFPPLEEQRRIAAILDKADDVRRKRKQAIALTEELLRSAFLEMFGDPVTNPKGWRTDNLGNLLAEPLQNGVYFQKECYVEDGTGIEMIHMSDAFYGVVKRGNLKRVAATSADIEKYGLNSNDVIVARRSLNYEGAAKPCLIPVDQKPLIFESSLIRVRVNRDILDPIFLFSYMLQPQVRSAFVFPHVTKSTISGINQAGLQRVQILVPPISIQINYRKLYEKVTSFRNVYERDLNIAETFFNSLLQKAFRGEL
ncbi:restriction endonuclease subunit S [Anabaena sp. 4-3]|uniref:restriction endonuclease subunit S n=1 Tax=Anabaena sp. 4-3 TaxID=1811979 RepID=UPI00082C6BDD|nr:restriction endonuclease subunit S [Anabaena sp. 4-3]